MNDNPPVQPPAWRPFRDKHTSERGWCYPLDNGWMHCHYDSGLDTNKSKANIEIIAEGHRGP